MFSDFAFSSLLMFGFARRRDVPASDLPIELPTFTFGTRYLPL
jgi:hypothetical protein